MPWYKCSGCRIRRSGLDVAISAAQDACPLCGRRLDAERDLTSLLGFRFLTNDPLSTTADPVPPFPAPQALRLTPRWPPTRSPPNAGWTRAAAARRGGEIDDRLPRAARDGCRERTGNEPGALPGATGMPGYRRPAPVRSGRAGSIPAACTSQAPPLEKGRLRGARGTEGLRPRVAVRPASPDLTQLYP